MLKEDYDDVGLDECTESSGNNGDDFGLESLNYDTDYELDLHDEDDTDDEMDQSYCDVYNVSKT